MTLDIDPGWVAMVFLLWLRIGTLFIMMPMFTGLDKFVVLRVLFTLALSVVMAPQLGTAGVAAPMSMAALVGAALSEVAVGATLGFGALAAFGAFSVAGKILDIQSGFGIGSVFDPVTRTGSPLFAMMLNMLGVTVFFSVDGHHALMRGIAFSVSQVAPGAGLGSWPIDAVIRQFGLMFSLGVTVIAPVMFCLVLIEVGFAMTSRVLPQMNVFVVSIPVKIVAALAMLAMTITTVGASMGRIYAAIFSYWEQVLVNV
ncbi:flagellar biosynthetic protein FliR [Massilia antarctica]|uniref:Flagellar biosynthetic protein FliR n=1 Tax=Massilia antarctica TaxID=2765360 RepID=A0AA49A6V3_9BURK|nr:flagellar biosynthetic protein FliR [Massilia antarctica]QPI48541.1 flagellar biosynthetic protein FliR [Massilia antarctica]